MQIPWGLKSGGYSFQREGRFYLSRVGCFLVNSLIAIARSVRGGNRNLAHGELVPGGQNVPCLKPSQKPAEILFPFRTSSRSQKGLRSRDVLSSRLRSLEGRAGAFLCTFSVVSWFLPSFLPVSLNLFLRCPSLPLRSKSGLPALLSLLLCILPGKAVRITYDPGWQALGADASSPLPQVTSLDSPGDGWDRSASRASSLSVLASFDINLHVFRFVFAFFSVFPSCGSEAVSRYLPSRAQSECAGPQTFVSVVRSHSLRCSAGFC